MNEQYKYDPEDIESLMKVKSFSELYPEEREFVLRYMDSEEEYESMRQTLLNIISANENIDPIEPRAEIKDDLLAAFHTEQKGGFMVWLNGVFAFTNADRVFYRQPAFQLALASLIVVFGVYFAWDSRNQDGLAIAEVKTEELQTDDKQEKPAEKETAEVENTIELTEDVELEAVTEEAIEDENLPAESDLDAEGFKSIEYNGDSQSESMEVDLVADGSQPVEIDISDDELGDVKTDDLPAVTFNTHDMSDIDFTMSNSAEKSRIVSTTIDRADDVEMASRVAKKEGKYFNQKADPQPLSADLAMVSYLYTAP